MNLRLFFVILISKLAIKICRFLHLGGTSFPGKLARKLYPYILKAIAAGHRIIMVTGTNGKTTTTSMIGHILSENGIRYISNKSGANLEYGIITTFIESYRFGRKNDETALLEIDEAAFPKVVANLEPDCIVVTNFFRDQLDRYGEIYTTVNKIQKSIENLKKTKLILNADDSLCSSLGRNSSIEKLYYGFEKSLNFDASVNNSSDAAYCIYCKTKYDYANRIYGHLGGYSCPNCHYSSPEADVMCSALIEASDKYSLIELSTSLPSDKKEVQNNIVKINVPGLYNIYNSMSAVTCGLALGLSLENSVKALERFENSFGRMENIRISNLNINIILVKNPTGFNQVLEYLSSFPEVNQLALLINDNAADGRDISWLWDVEFEKLSGHQDRFEKIYVSGTRAEDMALRLKYAGFDTKRIELVKDYNKIINSAISNNYPEKSFCILPTYTALLEIRRVLQKKIRLKEIWK